MKAQVSVEMLLMVAFFAMFLIPFALLFFMNANTSTQDVAVAQGQQAVRQIASTADEVYFGGVGSRQTIQVFIPPGVSNVTIGGASGREIFFEIQTESGKTEVVAMTAANVSSTTDWAKRQGSGVMRLNISFDRLESITVNPWMD